MMMMIMMKMARKEVEHRTSQQSLGRLDLERLFATGCDHHYVTCIIVMYL